MKRYKQWPKIVLIISRVQSPMKMIEKVKEGKYAVGIDGMEIEITREMVDLKVSVTSNVRECDNDWGKVYIDVEQDDDVKGEGFAEELVLKVNALKSTLAGGVRPKKLKIGARKELNALLSPFTDLIISKTSFENVAIVTHEDLARKKPAKHTIRGEEFSIWMG